jgi:hypothetical protein
MTKTVPVPSARASAGFGVVAKKGSKKASQKKKKTAVAIQQEPDPLLALSVKTLQQDGVVRQQRLSAQHIEKKSAPWMLFAAVKQATLAQALADVLLKPTAPLEFAIAGVEKSTNGLEGAVEIQEV